MRQRAIPLLAPKPRHRNGDGCYETKVRGLAVLNSPLLNKGSAFTAAERNALGLGGLLPPEISTLGAQVKRAYIQYERLPDALSKNIYLTALHDRNEVLFYRLFSEHLREMIPIVNDLTVGKAMEQYHHECRPPRGVYLSIDHPEAIAEAFANLGVGPGDIDLILATDAEQVLGIGDWGVGGIEVSIGKLAIYTAAGGVDPTRVIPVMLDVGTNRESLLDDPTYIGNRHARVRGERYDAFIAAYVKAVNTMFPKALLQWEDFAPGNGRRILEKYRDHVCTFNDDIQGTGAITLAAAISAVRVCGTPLRNQRVVIFGAGTAGIGVADQIRDAMVREGLSIEDATRRFWCVDRQGLLTADMAAHAERPIIFALSNPPARAEANPADLLAWTEGRALFATGSPCAPVTYRGLTYVVAQLNNAMLYPGLALGAIVSQASRISDGMFGAAASAVSSLVTVRQPGASLLPHVDDLRSVSLTVAAAVAETAEAEGLAGVKLGDIVQQVQDAMWQPEYRRIEAS